MIQNIKILFQNNIKNHPLQQKFLNVQLKDKVFSQDFYLVVADSPSESIF